MTHLDLTCAPAQHHRRLAPSDLRAIGAGLALVLMMGVPALLAPTSEVAPGAWHGNAAPHAVTAR